MAHCLIMKLMVILYLKIKLKFCFYYFQTVEKFYDRAVDLLHPKLVENLKGRLTLEEKQKRVSGTECSKNKSTGVSEKVSYLI